MDFHTGSTGTLSDLDGFSVQGERSYQKPHLTLSAADEADDFGFDPPATKQPFAKLDQSYSPPDLADPLNLRDWSGPNRARNGSGKAMGVESSLNNPLPSFEFDQMMNQSLSNPSTAVARFGQVTPPRSNSITSSVRERNDVEISTKLSTSERRKRGSKASVKESEQSPCVAVPTTRKRKNSRKTSATSNGVAEEDDRRKQSLEKNRLAAAKCRVNKKERTEQLQRDSHDKAVHNAYLKEQVMRMKEEVQQINALLLTHANCEGCKSPQEIQRHLSELGNDFFNHHLPSLNSHAFDDFGSMHMDMSSMDGDHHMMHDSYYSGSVDPPSGMLNPPLPDFDRPSDYDISTPMHRD